MHKEGNEYQCEQKSKKINRVDGGGGQEGVD